MSKQYFLNGSTQSIAEAAQVYNVKELTIKARLKSVGPRNNRLVHRKRLCDDR
jgi:hypothetical protein